MLDVFREEELVKRAKTLIVNGGTDARADVGPVVSKQVGTHSWLAVVSAALVNAFPFQINCNQVEWHVDQGGRER